MGQAELWFGAGREARNAVVVLIGSGVGASLISGGATYQGATSSAAEFGHVTVVRRRPEVPLRRIGMPRGLRRRGRDPGTVRPADGGR